MHGGRGSTGSFEFSLIPRHGQAEATPEAPKDSCDCPAACSICSDRTVGVAATPRGHRSYLLAGPFDPRCPYHNLMVLEFLRFRGTARRPNGPGLERKAYLSLWLPARLLRHIPRQRKRIITIPITATPSFMPSQTESKESKFHHLFPGENNVMRTASRGMHKPVAQLNSECLRCKKRWYLALLVNGFSAAVAKAFACSAVMTKSNSQGSFQ